MIFKKNLTVLYLQGGIGNLLFELSAALYFTNKNIKNIYVVELEKERILKLKKFINVDLIKISNFQKIVFGINIKEKNILIEILIRVLKKFNIHLGRHIHGGYFEEMNLNIKNFNNKKYVLTGYFQHPDYFSKTKETIIDMFLKNHDLSNDSVKNQIVVHLRRADYINHGWELSLNYYDKIISLLSKDSNFNKTKIKILSDDPFAKFAIQNIALEYGFMINSEKKENDELSDFIEIVCSSTIVMSNSSFCWWATVIGDKLFQKERTVFYPSGWIKGFNDCLKENNWKAVY